MKKELSFAEQVDMAIDGKLPFYTALKVCDTPQILLDVGCEQLPMLYTQSHLYDAIKEKSNTGNDIHYHNLSVDIIKDIPTLIANPVMIYDSLSRNDSIIVLVQAFDKDNNPIIVTIKPNGEGRYEMEFIRSNFITSVHGRNNFDRQIIRAIEDDKILYINKLKSQGLLERWGLQLSELTSNLSFNTIIHQSRNIGNGKMAENEEKQAVPFCRRGR